MLWKLLPALEGRMSQQQEAIRELRQQQRRLQVRQHRSLAQLTNIYLGIDANVEIQICKCFRAQMHAM